MQQLVSPLTSLYIAVDKGPVLPSWAQDTVSGIISGHMENLLLTALRQIRRRG